MMIFSNSKKQNGIVLVISLIMLLLLTIIGITSMRVTGLEEKMAGNAKNSHLAFQAAESALREGELFIANETTEPAIDSINVWGLDTMDSSLADATPWWFEKNHDWWLANARDYSGLVDGTDDDVEIATEPMNLIEILYIDDVDLAVEQIGTQKDVTHYYRITAKGTGSTDDSRQLLQSITARKF